MRPLHTSREAGAGVTPASVWLDKEQIRDNARIDIDRKSFKAAATYRMCFPILSTASFEDVRISNVLNGDSIGLRGWLKVGLCSQRPVVSMGCGNIQHNTRTFSKCRSLLWV
jgi:hypothetical protein